MNDSIILLYYIHILIIEVYLIGPITHITYRYTAQLLNISTVTNFADGVYSVTKLECVSIAQIDELTFGEKGENAILKTRRLSIKLMKVVQCPFGEVFLRLVVLHC